MEEVAIEEQPQEITKEEQPEIEEKCNINTNTNLSPKWKALLGTKFKSSTYDNSILCSYKIMCDIININIDIEITPNLLRRRLSEIYKTINNKQIKQITTMFSFDGKIEFSREIKSKTMKLEDLPLLDKYYISLTDILFLANEFNIPLIIVTSGLFKNIKKNIIFTKYLELTQTDNKFSLQKNKDFFILKQSGVIRNEPFIYELFTHSDKTLLNIDMFKPKFKKYLNESLDKLPSNINKLTILNDYIY